MCVWKIPALKNFFKSIFTPWKIYFYKNNAFTYHKCIDISKNNHKKPSMNILLIIVVQLFCSILIHQLFNFHFIIIIIYTKASYSYHFIILRSRISKTFPVYTSKKKTQKEQKGRLANSSRITTTTGKKPKTKKLNHCNFIVYYSHDSTQSRFSITTRV